MKDTKTIEFSMQIDPRGFSKKPTEEETRLIRKTIKKEKLDLEKLRNKLCYGHTVCPAIFDENQGFNMQQIFLVDVDEGRSVEENIKIADNKKIFPNIIYKTFSGNTCNQKHRLVFLFDIPIASKRKRDNIQNKLNNIFAGDKSTIDYKRLFYGGNVCYFYNPFTVLVYLKGGIISAAKI